MCMGILHTIMLVNITVVKTNQNCSKNKCETIPYIFSLLNISHFEVITECKRVSSSENTELPFSPFFISLVLNKSLVGHVSMWVLQCHLYTFSSMEQILGCNKTTKHGNEWLLTTYRSLSHIPMTLISRGGGGGEPWSNVY